MLIAPHRHSRPPLPRRSKAGQGAARSRGLEEAPPVDGRVHMVVQTDTYLEELTDTGG